MTRRTIFSKGILRTFSTLFMVSLFLAFGCNKNSTDPNTDNTSGNEITHTEDITQDVTWGADVVHQVDGVIVISNATLTIAPGTVVKMGADARIIIENSGGLIADGTSATITFTGVEKQAGYWDKLEFRSSASDQNCKLINCIIEYGGNDTAIITARGSGLTIQNSILRFSKTGGIYWDDEAAPVFEGNTITGCQETPIHTAFGTASYVGAGTYTGNTRNYVELDNGDITANARWLKLDVPYRLTGSSNVVEQGTLTIDAGAVVEMDADARIIIQNNGGITADGTAEAITITGAQAQKGFWDKLEFRSSASDANDKFINCIFEYGGNGDAMIATYDSSPTFKDCTIRNSAKNGAIFDYESRPVFEGNTVTECGEIPISVDFANAHCIQAGTYTGNTRDYIEINDGDLSTSVTWVKQDVPYRVTGASNSIKNAVLTIAPGTVIEMDNSARIIVDDNAGLTADGTSEMITFTGAQAQNGFWDKIEIRYGASAQNTLFVNCLLEYGGNGTGMVSISEIAPSFTNCTIEHSGGCGFFLLNNASPVLNNITYADNANGDVCQ